MIQLQISTRQPQEGTTELYSNLASLTAALDMITNDERERNSR